MKILYLVSDLDDAATWRRVNMLEAGGASVDVAGMRRGAQPLSRPATVLGRTYPGKFIHRAFSTLRLLLGGAKEVHGAVPDVILARNLEMLPLALRVQARISPEERPKVFYEVLDVHRLMLGNGVFAKCLRFIERSMCRRVTGVITSSPRFVTEYFSRYGQIETAPLVVENKVWAPDEPLPPKHPARTGNTLTIGWFGILRCAASLRCLDEMCKQAAGRVRLVLRGKPALDALPDFHQTVRDNPNIEFHGPYSYPDDLPHIYGETDIAWLVDRFDAGANSDWLLPNRLYESCAHGAIPLALKGTETARYLQRHKLGLIVPSLEPQAITALLDQTGPAQLEALRAELTSRDMANWKTTHQDCVWLVDQLRKSAALHQQIAEAHS
ncbi:hypothetical protein [Roseinatronobacter bogoriensis]|uniref:Glycosyl transferase n=1 Tax=Roseinatronobacter bogoriensis subsp. barguzinensis TaxID=441209 RepID=A0A2K8KD34_9RHOB|nr:hypothetical protein [Rhodobaca]ATX64668.1 glycosyl transferase [Rhodobaca barguzinensis]MBB4209492.1 succinoglycan biosynthesis protein ExoL [Rhodobaca bogoriensis DSM 18756]TDW35142.1 succinoglycan biosynthesis protein ExoL [Rhodobaca barguzinensis]TDY66848.1 succinoglycan biosynthesis protein ExoL [Rhodobaca bogoriensis DSM 18756]